MLTFDTLLKRAKSKEHKLSLYLVKLEDHIATIFRQVALYDFEHRIHTFRRQKGELTVKDFCQFWRQSQEQMYGDSVILTHSYDYWWCYISHFVHYPGYVYSYAFGQLLALSLYQQYLHSDYSFVKQYLEVLALGGSDYPSVLLKKLNTDIDDISFWQQGIKVFEAQYEEAKTLANELGLA